MPLVVLVMNHFSLGQLTGQHVDGVRIVRYGNSDLSREQELGLEKKVVVLEEIAC